MNTLSKPEISLKAVNKIMLTHFLLIFILIGTILSGTLTAFYYFESKGHLAQIKNEELYNLKLQKQIITKNFDTIIGDLLFLAKQNELQHLHDHATKSRAEISQEYLTFIKEKKLYDQIRFLDKTGMEVVRVNYNNGDPAIVPDDQLQPKGDRYYFNDTFKLSQGQVFVSPFDLNIENGKIEHPLKPMIRFGTPVFDNQGEKQGIVILNYLGKKLLSSLKGTDSVSPGDIMLLNQDNFWLISPKVEDEWGFMFEDRKDRRFDKTFPTIWQRMQKSADNQMYDSEHGLFTYLRVYPLAAELRSSSGAITTNGKNTQEISGREYYWKLVSHIQAPFLKKKTQSLLTNLFLLGALLFLLSSLPAWLIAQSMARKKLHQAELLNLAHYDILTGIPNRALFSDRLNQVYKEAVRSAYRFSLLYIDLDDFKEVNDELGHDAGDELLRKVAQNLLSCLRQSDTVARLGGDEFAIILNKIENPEDVVKVVRKIMDSLSSPFKLKGADKTVGFSVGISQFPQDAKDPETLLKYSDTAMYQAKQSGKNTYKFYS